MGLFGRKPTLAERFPTDRLSSLPLLLGASAKLLGKKHGMNTDDLWESRFFTDYLLGYPDHLDGIDQKFGSAVRQMIFGSLFGADKGQELFRKATGHLLLEDFQTKRGFGAGMPDGERYFRALEAKENAEDATFSFASMFEIGSVDPSQQTI